jgi:hypothetical protein
VLYVFTVFSPPYPPRFVFSLLHPPGKCIFFFTSSYSWYIYFPLLHLTGIWTTCVFSLLFPPYVFQYSISSSWYTYFPFFYPTVIQTREYVLSTSSSSLSHPPQPKSGKLVPYIPVNIYCGLLDTLCLDKSGKSCEV